MSDIQMSDIQRALDRQAKLEAEATVGPWITDPSEISKGVVHYFDPGDPGCLFNLVACWHPDRESQDAALIAHLRNQAALARAVIEAGHTWYEAEMVIMTYPRQFLGQVMLAVQHADKMRAQYRTALQAWAGHVLSETKEPEFNVPDDQRIT